MQTQRGRGGDVLLGGFGGREVGGFRALYRAARQGIFWPWDLTSEHVWEARIRSADLFGASSTQITTITGGRLSTITGHGSLTATFPKLSRARTCSVRRSPSTSASTSSGRGPRCSFTAPTIPGCS